MILKLAIASVIHRHDALRMIEQAQLTQLPVTVRYPIVALSNGIRANIGWSVGGFSLRLRQARQVGERS